MAQQSFGPPQRRQADCWRVMSRKGKRLAGHHRVGGSQAAEIRFPELRRIKFVKGQAGAGSHGSSAGAISKQLSRPPDNSNSSGFDGAWTTPTSELTPLDWPFVHGDGPGLHNFGNTCYLNSSLQCLLHCPPLANLLLSQRHSHAKKTNGKSEEFCVHCALERLAVQVHDAKRSKSAVAPKEFVANIRAICRTFRSMRQEDAHEFVHHVLERLTILSALGICGTPLSGGRTQKRLRAVDEMATVVHRIFGGCLQSSVTCTSCQAVSLKLDACLDISLEIASSDSVERSLRSFTKAERLEGANRYRCSKCNKMVVALKQMSIRRAPVCLTLQLKRFDGLRKNNRPVRYPEILDLKPFMISSPFDVQAKYRLCGVLVHVGMSSHSGHYFSYVRSSNGTWARKDDSVSQSVGLNQVLGQRAYLLFYTRVPADDPKTPQRTEISGPPNIDFELDESSFDDPVSSASSDADASLTSFSSVSGAESDESAEVQDDELTGLLDDAHQELTKGASSPKNKLRGARSPTQFKGPSDRLWLIRHVYREEYLQWKAAVQHLKSRKSIRALRSSYQQLNRLKSLGMTKKRLTASSEPEQAVSASTLPKPETDVEMSGQIFKEAGTWAGKDVNKPSKPEFGASFSKRARVWDSWDAAYDQGRQRKVKAPKDFDAEKGNPFQRRQQQKS